MDTTFEAHSTLTDRFQTTVPEPVRRALKLHKRDKLQFNISATGEVRLPRMPPSEAGDPALGPFLQLLAEDMAQRPAGVKAVDAALLRRVRALTRGVAFDLDCALDPKDE